MSTRTALSLIVAGALFVSLASGAPDLGAVIAEPIVSNVQDQQPIYDIKITGNTNARRRLAVPAFAVPGGTAEVQAAAKTVSQVLWDDLDFEGEFYMMPAEDAAKVPAADSIDTLRYDLWSELGVDAVVLGSVSASPAGLSVRIQIAGVRGELAKKQLFGKVYGGGGCSLRTAILRASTSPTTSTNSRVSKASARTRLASVGRSSEAVAGRVVENQVQETSSRLRRRGIQVASRSTAPSTYRRHGRRMGARRLTLVREQVSDVYLQNIFEVVGRHAQPTARKRFRARRRRGRRMEARSRLSPARQREELQPLHRKPRRVHLRQLTTEKPTDVAPVCRRANQPCSHRAAGKAQLYLIGATMAQGSRGSPPGIGVRSPVMVRRGEPHCVHVRKRLLRHLHPRHGQPRAREADRRHRLKRATEFRAQRPPHRLPDDTLGKESAGDGQHKGRGVQAPDHTNWQ